MTNCKSFCQYRGPFFLSSTSSPPLFFFFALLQTSPLFPPASYLALQSLNTTQSLFFFFFFSPLHFLLFYLPVATSPGRCQLCRLARPLRQIKCPIHLVSSPLHRAGRRALSLLSSPLSPLTATSPLHHRTSRSDRNWAK